LKNKGKQWFSGEKKEKIAESRIDLPKDLWYSETVALYALTAS